jgi:hypothetical protein
VGGWIGKNCPGGWKGRNRDYNYGPFRLGIWECGQVEAKEGLGTISRVGREGVSMKMNRVGGKVVLGLITGDHFVCGFGTVGGTGAMELLGSIYPFV